MLTLGLTEPGELRLALDSAIRALAESQGKKSYVFMLSSLYFSLSNAMMEKRKTESEKRM